MPGKLYVKLKTRSSSLLIGNKQMAWQVPTESRRGRTALRPQAMSGFT